MIALDDPRTWQRGEPVFQTFVELAWLLPDETELVEVGPRVAVALAADALGPRPEVLTMHYRRIA